MDLSEAIIVSEKDIRKQTDKAMLITIDGKDTWLPNSQIRIVNHKVYIARWILIEKGIVEEVVADED